MPVLTASQILDWMVKELEDSDGLPHNALEVRIMALKEACIAAKTWIPQRVYSQEERAKTGHGVDAGDLREPDDDSGRADSLRRLRGLDDSGEEGSAHHPKDADSFHD